MPSVEIALENRPDDAEVEVPYLGIFKNNTTTEVDQGKWDRFTALQPGATGYVEQDKLVISTAAAQAASEAHANLRAAVAAERGEPVGAPVGSPVVGGQSPVSGDPDRSEGVKALSDYRKSDLVEMAKSVGVEGYNDMTKDELVEALSDATASQPENQ